jgi:hypothetical protein
MKGGRIRLARKNAVPKSYARALFLVNEKCKLITQVWQKVALTGATRLAVSQMPLDRPPDRKIMKKQTL